ncbi:SAM-dependent methyltransferase [Spiractinospora alimapuensis]|uniref:SAM-dependent methyltransferase n=1 Tax=Spiractinospora alimapuensis TaxID=2820884 RepID=UPI001F1AC280|nr:SAM-dependent methyltransferase [Spiractinospora alimapuensis]QVQ51763.1 SAM-dependent methyltransferase [Spiractinospora alimapuensis]
MADDSFLWELSVDVPTPARVYNYSIGGKDHFSADREAALSAASQYPEVIDVSRENRLFLYRAVRLFARDQGISQFLDLGSGLPGSPNVHEVAHEFNPVSRVSYVDRDPMVLAHGRALLVPDDRVAVVEGDVMRPEVLLDDLVSSGRIDLSQPVGMLLLSVPQFVAQDRRLSRALEHYWDAVAPGSYLAVSQLAALSQAEVHRLNEFVSQRFRIGWRARLPEEINAYLGKWVPVEPGLGDVDAWRPDPTQPPITDIDERGQRFLGASRRQKRIFEYGGVLYKPE